jgi:hypothetical protein
MQYQASTLYVLPTQASTGVAQINEYMEPYAAEGWELVTAYGLVAPDGSVNHYFYWKK